MKHKAGTPESQWEPDPYEADMRPLSEANKGPAQKVGLGKRKQASSAHPNQRFVPDDVTSNDNILASSIFPPALFFQSWIFGFVPQSLSLDFCFSFCGMCRFRPARVYLTYYPPWVLGVFHACRRVPGTHRRGNLVTLANRRPHRGVEFLVTNSTGYFEASSCP